MRKLSLISKGRECLCEKKRYKYRKKYATGKSRKHLLACLGLLHSSCATPRFRLRQAIEHSIVKCLSSTLTFFPYPSQLYMFSVCVYIYIPSHFGAVVLSHLEKWQAFIYFYLL